jgi:PAS domain S-box-containing protein
MLKEDQEREMNIISNKLYQNIEQSLKNCQATLVLLAFTINDNGVPQNFDVVSKELIKANPIISTLQVDPGGIIKYIYPMQGNKEALNLNILDSQYHKKEIYNSINTKKIYFAGPSKLKQGGMGILGWLPVYKDNKFWGFTTAIIKLKNLLKTSGSNSFNHAEYEFLFSNIHPKTNQEEFYFSTRKKITETNYISKKISNSNWKIYLIEKNPSNLYLPLLVLGTLGILIGILIGLFTTRLLKTPEKLRFLLKEQETKLLKNELKFKTIFDQATIGFAIMDAHSNDFIEVNNKYCDMLGYTFDEIKKIGITNLTHPDDANKNSLNFQKLKEGKIRDYSSEIRYITKSGETIWVTLTASCLCENNEKPLAYIAFIKDITAKKEADLVIEQSEKRFKSIFDNSPLPLWEEDFSAVKNRLVELDLINKNPKDVLSYFNENPEEVYKCISLVKIIDVNDECLKLHKIKDKKTLLENLSQLIATESIDDVKLQLVAISQNEQNFSIDSLIKDMDGQYHNIYLRWNVKFGYEDSYGMVIVSTQDITDRKTAEADIFNSHQRTESIINTIDGIVWEYDLKTMSSTFISEKVEQILGYSVEDYMQNPTFWEDHIYPEDLELALGLSSIVNKRYSNHDYEYRMIAKDGKIIWIRDIVNFVFENEEPIISRGIMIDITIMKEAERDLNNSFNLVSEQNKRLLNFSYIVSHNLRSHTSNIESIISLIESAESEDERNEMMKLLKSVSNSLDDTMNHLNEVVNINTNISLVIKTLSLNHFINKALDVLSEQIQLNQASFIIDVPNDAIINYNSAYLESILYNLISNAIRYKHPQRKPIITIKLYKKRDKNVIEISDNGIGIDLAKNGDKIFGMYKTFSNNSDARGIGLFITKNQVDAMGGTITVESIPTIGTTFKIYTT